MARLIRDWTDSKNIHKLSAEGERFFTRLIMKADDFGRYYGDWRLLRAYLFPLHKLREEKINAWMKECVDADLIFIYEADGKQYLEIKMFGQKLKVRRSKYPPSNGEDQIALKEGYVYIVGTEYTKPVKVGFSVNPWARLKELTISHPEHLEVLLTFKADKKFESELHRNLKHCRVKNEWFQLSPDAVDSLILYSKAEINKEDLIVAIRSNSYLLRSSPEEEDEDETEKETEDEGINRFFEFFRRAAGSHIADGELKKEIGKFINKYPNAHPNQSGGLVNAWVANIGKKPEPVKKLHL
jgi:hypothetical protein